MRYLHHRVIWLVIGLLCAASALAADLDLSPEEALAKAQAGEIRLIDIRTPPEWRQTGVAPTAQRLDMTDPKFVEQLLNALNGDKAAPIALICRTGSRSGYAQKQLQKLGFTQVYNIPEGMIGNPTGPGWIRRGLPVDSCTNC